MARKKKLTPEEFLALLPRILAAADAPMAVMEFEPSELYFDLGDVDLEETLSTDFLSASLSPSASSASPVSMPTASMYKSRPILIRVPERVILAFKHEAKRTGGHYQTLMNKSLKATADELV